MQLNENCRAFYRRWLTGNDEKDAQSLKRAFRSIRLTIGQWREVVKQSKG